MNADTGDTHSSTEQRRPQREVNPGGPSDNKVLLRVFLFGLGIGLAVGYLLFAGGARDFEKAVVASVIDGQTVELRSGERVRYLGIDTAKLDPSFQEQALALNKKLVDGKVVELKKGESETDKEGRLLRYVYVDKVLVNGELLAEGLAEAYISDADDPHTELLVRLEQYGRMKERGIWEKKRRAD